MKSSANRGGADSWADRLLAPGRGLLLAWWALAEAAVVLALTAAGLLLGAGLGCYLLRPSFDGLRRVATTARDRAERWGGVAIPAPYRALPPPRAGLRGRIQEGRALLDDPATLRDLWWSMTDPYVGAALASAPAALIGYGAFGAFVQPFVWRPIERAGGSNWYTAVHVHSTATALAAAAVGLALIAAGLLVGPPVLRLHARWTALLLAPSRSARLHQRVTHLADTRAEAVDTRAAELRRIERDLHDGAQARLVAVGMSLGNAEQLIGADPEAARELVVLAREASSKALEEMRNLVRGIHPPVLADRGIADAVRALALDALLDVEVRAQLAGRPTAPIESAAYFAVSELLANAAKHSGASRVDVVIGHRDGTLTVEVGDDGRGGADPALGTGLRGVGRRLAAFDGTLTVASPPGGPTTILLEIPCVLSSQKTSSSCGTDWSAP
ncbi:sensor histidine kinase [Kitasatospora sp. NBC_01250]|uniref:sensor histidine kinase n=1 Tax=Kitasatospora sp. NBC_01250 TaxID=2903571 RepID=UPI002E36A246|nr:histidine kinase [Kitasatospora sp. NBC_01250]